MTDALIRICNGCNRCTAIDMEDTPEHRKDLEMCGQTVCVVTPRQAIAAWESAGPCVCKKMEDGRSRP